jgi:hypothetical protein
MQAPTPAELELELLTHVARSSAARLSELLDDDFVEIGQSGKLLHKADIVALLPTEGSSNTTLHAIDLKSRQLADGLLHLTYLCAVHDSKTGGLLRSSRRSSIWRSSSGAWKLLFHQGTAVSPEPTFS